MFAPLDSLAGLRAWCTGIVESNAWAAARVAVRWGFLGAQSTLPELQRGLLMAQIHRSTAPLEGALDAVTEHAELLAVT